MKFNFKTLNYESPVAQQGNPPIRTSVASFLFEDVISEIYVALDELTEYCRGTLDFTLFSPPARLEL
jgi:hypothetical protein